MANPADDICAQLLPGVPEAIVRARLQAGAGDEIGSGKLASPESSAALAVNAFGWFIERPALFPPLPAMDAHGPVTAVDVEVCLRFPWRGGRHPWLDALLVTPTHLIGVESKRFEPFRDRKLVALSPAYDRPVWGDRMQAYGAVRDRLRAGDLAFRHLDAAQLVKHAYGLVTQGARRSLAPVLCYLFAEPEHRGGKPITLAERQRHRDEASEFAALVAGDDVVFHAASYREWMADWDGPDAVVQHRDALTQRFSP